MQHLLERQYQKVGGQHKPASWNRPEDISIHSPYRIPNKRNLHTVFSANIPITLSHSVPLFGCHPNSLERACDRCSTLSTISTAAYVFPERPHVNGFLDLFSGRRPWSWSRINGSRGTVSGGSRFTTY